MTIRPAIVSLESSKTCSSDHGIPLEYFAICGSLRTGKLTSVPIETLLTSREQNPFPESLATKYYIIRCTARAMLQNGEPKVRSAVVQSWILNQRTEFNIAAVSTCDIGRPP